MVVWAVSYYSGVGMGKRSRGRGGGTIEMKIGRANRVPPVQGGSDGGVAGGEEPQRRKVINRN